MLCLAPTWLCPTPTWLYPAPPGYGPPPPGYAPPPPGRGPTPCGNTPPSAHLAPPFQAPPTEGERAFFIRSELNGKVLDINGANPNPGTQLGLWTKKPQPENSQLWYIDNTGVIRSKLNHFAIDASGKHLVMKPYNRQNTRQQWIFQGNRIVNRHNDNEVVDIYGGENNREGAPLCTWRYNGARNYKGTKEYKESKSQQWTMEYV